MGDRTVQPTPDSVEISTEPRRHELDPTLGVDVTVDRNGVPPNRLVTIGDSITQGFMSGAVFRTDRSWPALVAHELGLELGVDFRFPVYEPPSGPGGLPFDLERAVRGLGDVVGRRLDWHEVVRAGLWLRGYMDRIEDYWEGRGDPRFELPPCDGPYHNLGVYGADLVDVQVLNAEIIDQRLADPPSDDLVGQLVERDNDIGWQVVLDCCGDRRHTVLDAAAAMGKEGSASHGIETLVVMLGSNNALGSVVSLDPQWTPDDYLDTALDDRLALKGPYNVWQPEHFADEWEGLVGEIRAIEARHVIFATVPQVTIAPIARGVRGKVRNASRFFPYYTRPWINDVDFDPERDPHIDEQQARAIDSAIDAFNETIIETVRDARSDPADPRDWLLFDLGALLDRVASKRYLLDPLARPSWWTEYELPPQVAALEPPPIDTKFFTSGPAGRTQGGLFSLDGVHPTTIAAGLVAREIVRIMDRNAGVAFAPGADGDPRPPGTVDVDFDRVLALDTLNADPPSAIESTLAVLGWFDQRLDWVRRITGFGA